MPETLQYKQQIDKLEIQYEILPIVDEIEAGEKEIDALLEENQKKIDELTKEIEDLTVSADMWDYAISACSGVLAGTMDILLIGELSFSVDLKNAIEWGDEQANKFVLNTAKKFGYKGSELSGAVKCLENKFPLAADKVTNEFGGGYHHHLRDFSHHPTPLGLFCSLFTQFTNGWVVGTDVHGAIHLVKIKDGSNVIGKDFYEKVFFGVINWIFHLVSDMAGSYDSVKQGKRGTGLPGPIVSILKELSALPIFAKVNGDGHKELSVWIQKLFNGTLLADHDENNKNKIIKGTEKPFDLRAEIGFSHEIGKNAVTPLKQASLIILNECIVRSFYFLKQLSYQLKQNKIESVNDFIHLEWKKILPFNNPTLVRMLTVSTGTMEVIDITDAAIRGAIKAVEAGGTGGAGGTIGGPVGTAIGAITAGTAAFLTTFVMHINVAGVGRMVVYCKDEVAFAVKKEMKLTERLAVYDKSLRLTNAKVYYREADMWIAAQDAGKAIDEAYQMIEIAKKEFSDAVEEIDNSLKNMDEYLDSVETKNPGLKAELLDTLMWEI